MGIRALRHEEITQEMVEQYIGKQMRFYYDKEGRDIDATMRIGLIADAGPTWVRLQFNNNPLSVDKTGFKTFSFDKIAKGGASIVLQ